VKIAHVSIDYSTHNHVVAYQQLQRFLQCFLPEIESDEPPLQLKKPSLSKPLPPAGAC